MFSTHKDTIRNTQSQIGKLFRHLSKKINS